MTYNNFQKQFISEGTQYCNQLNQIEQPDFRLSRIYSLTNLCCYYLYLFLWWNPHDIKTYISLMKDIQLAYLYHSNLSADHPCANAKAACCENDIPHFLLQNLVLFGPTKGRPMKYPQHAYPLVRFSEVLLWSRSQEFSNFFSQSQCVIQLEK